MIDFEDRPQQIEGLRFGMAAMPEIGAHRLGKHVLIAPDLSFQGLEFLLSIGGRRIRHLAKGVALVFEQAPDTRGSLFVEHRRVGWGVHGDLQGFNSHSIMIGFIAVTGKVASCRLSGEIVPK